jgi:hypothetical protein
MSANLTEERSKRKIIANACPHIASESQKCSVISVNSTLVLLVTMMEYLGNNGQSNLMTQFNIAFVRMKMEPLTSPKAT